MTKLLKFNNCFGSQIKLQAFASQFLASLLFVSLTNSAAIWAQEPAQPTTPSWTAKELEFFESKIRPVLVEKCYKCHSENSEKLGGGLRVDLRAGLLDGGDSGPAIEPGKPRDSLLLQAIQYKDDDYAMPPRAAGGKLPDAVIADFEKWIRDGAADPREGVAWVPEAGAGEAAKNWWAFQPLNVTAPPEVKLPNWPQNEIDLSLIHI